MAKRGRPTKLTQEVKDEICARIARGESLVKILDSDEKFPEYTNVCKALRNNEEFRQMYARAKEEAADVLADEIISIADDGSRDYKEDEEGRIVPDYDHIQRSKLRVDARKWIASKLKPKKYGDKLQVGGDGDGDPVKVKVILDGGPNPYNKTS